MSERTRPGLEAAVYPANHLARGQRAGDDGIIGSLLAPPERADLFAAEVALERKAAVGAGRRR